MILARSPYYVQTPSLSAATAAKLTLKVNVGSESTSFTGPDYEIEKNRPSSSTFFMNFEISNLVSDKFVHNPIYSQNTALFNSNLGNVLSVNHKVQGIGGGSSNTETNVDVFDGYGHHLEGANPQLPSSKLLLAHDYYMVNKDGYFNLPIYNDGTYDKVTVNGTGYPLVESTSINSKMKNMWLKVADFSGAVTINLGPSRILLEVLEECRHTPHDIMFKNKYGAWEIMTFFKAKKESIEIDRSTFKNNMLIGAGYDQRRHTYQDFNINARESLKLNSGYVPEAYNETIQQLLLSRHVFLLDDEHFHIPLNVDTSSYQYKTRLQDKLISHEIDFKYAFDLINNI